MSENYYLLDDMERYMPDFNRGAYEHLSVSDLIPICRDYYSKHLPVDVTTWIRVNEPSKDLIYGDGLGKQVVFVRDVIGSRLFYKLRDKKDKCIETYVIGTHCSKSVLLPVMEIKLKKYGVNLIFRYNFYDWCVSVESEKDLNFDHKGLVTDEKGYYEGFPKDRIYDNYQNNQQRFSFCMTNDEDLYTYMFLLVDYLLSRDE